MSKFYNSAKQKSNQFSKKLFLILLCIMGIFGSLQAQNVTVSGTIVGVVPVSYPTLKAAFDAINAGSHTGAITVSIIGSTLENATAQLNSSSLPSFYTSVNITPSAVGRVITGNISTAVVKLNGADNVTIDGNVGGVRGLTFSNSSATNTSGIIWVGSASSADPAVNNIIRNCIVTGAGATVTLVGIGQTSGTTLGGQAEAPNSNNTYTNNLVSLCQFGIGVVGGTGTEDDNTQIISNNVNTIGRAGIFLSTQKNVVTSKNIISGVNSNLGTFTIQNSGILVVGSMINGLIEKNIISNVRITSFWGCNGIQLQCSNSNTNLTIVNNFIYDISAGGFNEFDTVDDNACGIAVNSGGGYNIWYNSIDLDPTANQPSASLYNAPTAAIWIATPSDVSPAPTGLSIKNNIFSNRETTGQRFCVFSNSPASAFTSINYNDYYVPTGGNVGFLTSIQANLANWQASSGGDANSVSVNPIFTSISDLHLLGSSPLDALATPIGGITVDVDGDIRNASTPDIGADEFTPLPCNVTTGGTAAASNVSICGSGTSILSATGYSYGLNTTYQWQWSSTGGAPWNNLAGQTNPLIGNTGTIFATTYYQLLVTCTLTSNTSTSTIVTVTVNNPSVTGASAVPRCGVGTTPASATGTNLQWYTAAAGGTPFATGSPITTPLITSTTTFYVTASSAGINCAAGKNSTAGPDGGYNGTDAGIVFDATQAFTLTSVKMYPQGATTIIIQALTSAGALIAQSAPITFAGATSTGVVVPLGFNIPVGISHRLIVSSNSSSIPIWRDFSGNSYPYPICTVGSMTNGWISGTIGTYYFFYDWQVTTSCESTRTPVTATVNAPPVFATFSPAAGAPRIICNGGSVTLNATGGGYSTYTWNPGALPNGSVVSPAVTTTYTLTANIPGGCRRDSIITITVNSTPTALTVTPASAATCPNTPTMITAAGGLIQGQSIFTETAETFPLTQFSLTGTGVVLNQSTTYYSQGLSSIWLTHTNSSNGSIETGNIPLTGFTSPKLTFDQIPGLEASSGFHYDVGYVEYSTDNGTNWTKFPATAYGGSGTLVQQISDASPTGVGFDNTSYPDVDAQFSSFASTPGVGPATALWKPETIDLSTWQGSANFKIRFRILADGSVLYYGWLIDNIKIIGTGQAPVTWTPITNLFTQPGLVPYVAGANNPVVYYNVAVPTAALTYTATATSGVSCTSTATSTISAGSIGTPSLTLTKNPPGTICGGTCVTFNTNTVNAGATPAFEWFVNNISQGASLVGANTFTKCTLANNDKVHCKMSVLITGSCATTFVVYSDTLTMSVNPKPTATPITGGTTVCNGQITVLTETAVGTITNYNWLLNGSSVQSGALNTYNATLPGSYRVIVTTNLGCKDTSAILVVTLPTYTITATAGPNGNISPSGAVVVNCGSSQVFTITPNAGYAILDVLVNGTSVGTPGTYTFNNVTGDSTIDVTFWFPGCATPATADAGPDGSTCGTAIYNLAGTSIGGSAGSGTWSSSGSGTFSPSNNWAGAAATSYTPSAGDVGTTVTLTLLTDDPPGSCPASSSSMNLTVKVLPAVTITGQIGICAVGATQTLLHADTSATTVHVTSFHWYHPFPTTIGANLDTVRTPLIGGTGNYSVVVTGANGCSGSDLVTVNILPAPTGTLSGVGPICTDAGIDINAIAATASGTINANGYAWYNPSLIVGANVSILTATAAGTYTASATNSYGCIGTLTGSITLAMDNSPLNGLYTIGVGPATCTNYISFARAISDLNTRGISGNVLFSVPAGYVETVPSKGLKLGSALLNPETATGKTISFARSGAGANPKLIAFTGGSGTAASTYPDGIWCLRGVDNVSINKIDLTENAANTTSNPMMEYGYGLSKYSASDGAQNNTIQGCVITLNKVNSANGTANVFPDGSNGIVIMNAVDTAVLTQFTPASALATNSNNKFYGNTIINSHGGIALMGFASASPFTTADAGNDIGGASAATGNNILNFGNAGDGNAAIGVRLYNQWGSNVSFNTIRNNNYDGTGANTTNDLRGIRGEVGLSASATYSGNTIILRSNAPAGQNIIGIDNAIGSTAAGNTILISDNTIIDSATVATAAVMTGIINSATSANVNISNNSVQDCLVSGTGAFTGISNTAVSSSLILNSNSVTNNQKTTGGVMTLLAVGAPTAASITSNILSNNNVIGGATTTTFSCITGAGAGSSYTLDGNTLYNNSATGMTGAAVATLIGYINSSTPFQETITDNTIRKLFVTGTSTGVHVITGLRNVTSNNAAQFRIIARNFIDSLYTNSTSTGTITGIFSGVGFNVSISKNKIHSLWPGQNGAGASFAKAIFINSGTTVKVSNNIISDDLTQAAAPAGNGVMTGANAVIGIEAGDAVAGGTVNLYYNTIRLAGAGGAGFGSSGIYLSSINSTVDIRDNLVANYMTPGAGGMTVGLRRTSAGSPGYATTSNNNLWYTTQTATTPIYYNGTSAFNTLALFQGNVAPREAVSIGDNPVFVNAAQNNLHLDPANNCNIDGAGAPIATYADDYDTDPRDAVLPDIGMDEFSGTGAGWTWKGYNTDWMNPSNWCGGVPTAASDVIIPAGKTFYPNITTGAPVAHNININAGASITIAATGTLSNTGSWTNDGTLTNNGLIVLNGTVNQSFPGGGAGTMPAMFNLTVDNTAGATINKAFTITGTLKPKTGQIAVNDVVTLHSDLSGTARVDTVMGSFTYNAPGSFIVERYVSTKVGAVAHTGWRFLSIPTATTQTINQAWMEGQAPNSYTGTGYGTIIVGPGGTGVGFDQTTTTPSMKTYAPATNTWVSVTGTAIPIATTEGYMIFLRGDRAANTFGSSNSTTLRTQGPIKTGNVTVSTANGNLNTFISTGNPYPSAISFSSASTTKTGLQDVYYVWDPKLSTYGAYQTFAGPTYTASPGGGSYGGGNKAIESGQAFFVVSNGSNTVHSFTMTENSKVSSNVQVARTAGLDKQLSTRLYLVTGTDLTLYDGNRVDFDAAYSNAIDDNDARKLSNFGENIGILRDGQAISVERRAEIVNTDTIFYQLGQLRQQQYQLEFTAENLASPILTAYLEDAYLHTSSVIDLNAVTTINFTVNADAASKASDRFRLVFRQLGIVPLSFTSVTAIRQDKNVLVSWKVENELNIANYEVEHSADGRNFSKLGTEAARGNGSGTTQQYSWLDVQPYTGDNFYRIKSVGNNADVKYSQIVKVNMSGDPSMITVYPNPVREDGIIKISLTNEPKDQYRITLFNTRGQEILSRTINHEGGNSVYTLDLDQFGLTHGTYLLQVGEGNKVKTTFKIVY